MKKVQAMCKDYNFIPDIYDMRLHYQEGFYYLFMVMQAVDTDLKNLISIGQ